MISDPASARPIAMAFPIPLVAPVRIAVFPESEKRDDDMGESQLVIDVMQNISAKHLGDGPSG